MADVPTNPLLTSTRVVVPIPVIGPIVVVPNPTLTTFIYSSSTFNISPPTTEEIPLKEIVVLELLIPVLLLSIFSFNVWLIGVNANGDWIKLLIVIIAFVLLLAISNRCAFPVPTPTKVTAAPALVVDIWKLSLLILIANTLEGNSSIPWLAPSYCIGVDPIPIKLDLGV